MVEAVQKWRQYLLGRRFFIHTDHKSLREILQQRIHTPDQQNYIRKLLGYDFVIEYKPGKNNAVADALSHAPEVMVENVSDVDSSIVQTSYLTLISTQPVSEFLDDLHCVNKNDPELVDLHNRFARQELPSEYHVVDSLLAFNHKYVIPSASPLKHKLLHEFHNSRFAGHGGVKKTLVGLITLFYWPKMRLDVEKFVRECQLCQQVKSLTAAPTGLLQPLPVLALIWNEVTIDFVNHLPKSRGISVILVVVDSILGRWHQVLRQHG